MDISYLSLENRSETSFQNIKGVEWMLKQSFSRITKVLTVLLAVLFVATMTVGAASACSSERGSYHDADCEW